MKTIAFTKVESVGNDFVLIAEDAVSSDELSPLTKQVCRRGFSIGSDGLLTVAVRDGDLWLRMFNPDGTEDFCGNGIRCAVWYAYQNGLIGPEAAVHHLDRIVHTSVHADGVVRSKFQSADFNPRAVPTTDPDELFLSEFELSGRKLLISALTTGSTHTVILGPLPSEEDFQKLSPLIEHAPLFLDRTSVIWAQREGDRSIKIRIWERGVGETLGCGTGSAAAAVVFARANSLTGAVEVRNPGGTVHVVLPEWDAPLYTEAKAKIVFSGKVSFTPQSIAGAPLPRSTGVSLG